MVKYTNQTIREIIKSENVKFFRLQFSDILGIMKNVEVPLSQLDTLLEGKVMFDGSSIEGFVRISESDMYLKPDLNSFKILTWEKPNNGSKVGTFMCDIYRPSGEEFEGDPRLVLRNALKRMETFGYKEFNIGLEPEFFLFKTDQNGNPTTNFTDHGGYFDIAPLDQAADCRRDIVLELEKMGFTVEASHHEVSQSQHEINFKFANALEGCDNVQIFKLAVKNIASEHGMFATFMPKPIANINGSGMHANLSLFDYNGKNIFYDENSSTGLSQTAYHFIAGLLKHAPAYTALTNPTINSYKRLVPGYEAPCYISYSDNNRSAMIRIPATRQAGTRVEVRSVDPTANPYLSMAALLHAGLDGIENKLDPGGPTRKNIFEMSQTEKNNSNIRNLPNSLLSAVLEMEKSTMIEEALGKHIFESFCQNKRKEYNKYSNTVHQWEIDTYMKSF
jgi:glutamine synthetase